MESEEAPESAHAETDPLVLEMEEHARELARESSYAPDERFVVTMTGENFPDSKDAFAIWDYVKEEYYGYSDGKVQTFADYVSASEALQEIRGRNMEAEKSLQLCSQNRQLGCSRIIVSAIRCIWTERHLRLKSRAF